MERYKILRKYRILNQLTQKEVAEKLNMTHSGYSKYERGERKLTIEMIMKLMPIIKMPLSALEEEEELRYDQNTMEFWLQYEVLADSIIAKRKSMTKVEIDNARELFTAEYEKNENKKKDIIKLLQPEKLEDIAKLYGVAFLYK